MVIEINKIPRVKATIKTVMKDLITMRSNVFDVRVGDIELMSIQAPL